MTLRDLGYRPYDGPRLPPSNSTWVMFRYGLSRALSPLGVKILLGLTIFPGLIFALGAFFAARFSPENFELEELIKWSFWVQTWFFVGLAGLLAGASAISEDLQARAFPIFFAKPLTPIQYLLGRVLAVAALLFFLALLPSFIFVVVFAGTAPAELRVDSIGFLLPVIAHSLVVATAVACTSVGLSATTRNRAITVSLFIVLWFVPAIVAKVVHVATGQAWLNLMSIPNLLGIVGDALLQKPDDDALPWYWAMLALLGYSLGGLAFAKTQLDRAEVVA